MDANRALRAFLSFLPLFAIIALFPGGTATDLSPAALFAILAIYGRIAAFANSYRGKEEAFTLFGFLPFAAYGGVAYAKLDPSGASLFFAETTALLALLLSAERLLVPKGGGFALVLLFSSASIVAALGVNALPPATLIAVGIPVASFVFFLDRRRSR